MLLLPWPFVVIFPEKSNGEREGNMTTFLQQWRKFEIQAYRPPKNRDDLEKNHVSFSGSPFKHPTDKGKVILIPDPYSVQILYYEFRTADIGFAEELASVVDDREKTVSMVRIWVKKGGMALRCTPFRVEDTSL
jgi:hypothetical protein